jgi:dihydroorotase
VLTEMAELTEAGCVGFSQAEVPLVNTQVLQRALQYASHLQLHRVAAPAGAVAGQGRGRQRRAGHALGLSGVPVAAETIALHTIFELVRATGARVHLCRISSAAGRGPGAPGQGRRPARHCDISINSLHLTDTDIGYFDSRMRLNPPLRQQRDRDALREGLADGTIDALVSATTRRWTKDAKTLPFAEAEPGATGLELLLSLALKWGQESGVRPDARAGRADQRARPRAGHALGTLQASAGPAGRRRRGRCLRVRPAGRLDGAA